MVIEAALVDQIVINIHQAYIFLAVCPSADRVIDFLMDQVSILIGLKGVLLIVKFAAQHNNQNTACRKMAADKIKVGNNLLCCVSADKFIFFGKLPENVLRKMKI